MPKSDKDILYTEVYGAKVGLPQYYDDNGDPVEISTQNLLPVQLSGAGVEGKSAYEVAVDNGFEGTEEEWLESLKGKQGDKGDPFTYEDFTEEQLESLKGPQGNPGKDAEPQFTEDEVAALKALISEPDEE